MIKPKPQLIVKIEVPDNLDKETAPIAPKMTALGSLVQMRPPALLFKKVESELGRDAILAAIKREL